MFEQLEMVVLRPYVRAQAHTSMSEVAVVIRMSDVLLALKCLCECTLLHRQERFDPTVGARRRHGLACRVLV